MARWTDSDNLHGRAALVVGGPNNGLRVVVNDSVRLRYPEVLNMPGYTFDRERWEFRYREDDVWHKHVNEWHRHLDDSALDKRRTP